MGVGQLTRIEHTFLCLQCSSTPRTDDDARQTLAVDNESPYLDNEHPLLEMDGVM